MFTGNLIVKRRGKSGCSIIVRINSYDNRWYETLKINQSEVFHSPWHLVDQAGI